MPTITNISDALKWGKSTLLSKEIKDAELSAELLLAEVVDISRVSLYSNFENELNENQQKTYQNFIERRSANEPVQYILGHTYFYELKILCESGVLIPRPETEQMVDFIIDDQHKLINEKINILDLCCGTGCISCAVANAFKNSKVLAVDISDKACKLTAKNAKLNNLEGKIKVKKDDIRAVHDYGGNFDFVISNPPYVPKKIIDSLDDEVKNYEPTCALDGGEDGMLFFEDILTIADKQLKDNGTMYLEFYEDNYEALSDMVKAYGYKDIRILKDLNAKPRFIKARKLF